MSAELDAIVIGAGHNGLVAAAYLARAGRRVVVFERSGRPGGLLETAEIAPGVRAPGPLHTVGRLRASVVRDLGLIGHGLELIRPDVRMLALQPDGAPIVFHGDVERTAEGLRSRSSADAEAYPRYDAHVRTLTAFLARLNGETPPDLDRVVVGDLLAGFRLGRGFRGLEARTRRELTRALPMAVADFVGEWFENEGVRGALAARGTLYTAMGPWSAGTAAVLLNDAACEDGGAAGESVQVKGGPGALADALAKAATRAGASIRCGSEVASLLVEDGRVVGVRLAGGRELRARAVVSAADPKTTIQRWLDPVAVGPQLYWQAGNIRTPGSAAKVDLALARLPRFDGVDSDELLRGRIAVAPELDYSERAFDASKYGAFSDRPFIEATIPTLSDPTLAPAGQHVLSMVVQWAPYALRGTSWDSERDRLANVAIAALERHAPGLSQLVTAQRVLAPPDIEAAYGPAGGHVLHAEPGLDQFFAWRPLFGHGRYRLALDGLWLCGSGAHPGGGVTGAPGANAARELLKALK